MVAALVVASLYEPLEQVVMQRTCGLVAMTSAPHAEGRQFDPGQVYSRGAVSSPHTGACGGSRVQSNVGPAGVCMALVV